MKKISLFVTFCTIPLLVIYSQCCAENILNLNVLIEEALANNPEIMVFQKRKDALWERPAQVKAWDDPLLTFGVSNVPTDDFDFDTQDMTQKYVAIKQNIPFFGVTSLREKAAIETAKGAESELEDIRLNIVSSVKKAYYQIFFVNEALKITEANEKLLNEFVEISQAKYEVGEGLQEDILKAQVELYKMQEKLIDLRQQKETLQAELNTLLNRAPSAALEGSPALQVTQFAFEKHELEEIVLAENALLQALQHDIKKTEAEHALAKKMYFPKFTVTAAYGQRDKRPHATSSKSRITDAQGNVNEVTTRPLDFDTERPSLFTLLVGVNVPLWFKSKQNRGVAEAYHRIAQSRSRYESVRNDIFFKTSDLYARIIRGKDLIALYKDSIIPQAGQSLDAAIEAYRVGKIDFLTLLDSQITLFNYEIQYRKVMTDYEKDLAALEVVMGKSLF